MRLDSLICSWQYEFVKRFIWVVGVYVNGDYNCIVPLTRVIPVGATGREVRCCNHYTTNTAVGVKLKLFLYKVSVYGMGLNKRLLYICKVSQK